MSKHSVLHICWHIKFSNFVDMSQIVEEYLIIEITYTLIFFFTHKKKLLNNRDSLHIDFFMLIERNLNKYTNKSVHLITYFIALANQIEKIQKEFNERMYVEVSFFKWMCV